VIERRLLFALALLLAAPAVAQTTLSSRVEALLAEAGPGVRFGLVVSDEAGREIVAINPDQRFIPASNTKMFTTAAAFAVLPVDLPDGEGGAAVRIEGRDVVLEGHGDARLSSAEDCVVDCLATLADAVAARTRQVRDVIGDDTAFPDERWSPGMSWNNIPTRSGTGISALTLDDNELVVRVTPGADGAPAIVEAPGYVVIDNRAVTLAAGAAGVGYERLPMARTLRITGSIAVGAAPVTLRTGIDDPADYAAWRLRAMLVARGVKVSGRVTVRHRPLVPDDDPVRRGDRPVPRAPAQPALARLTPPPLAEDLRRINKTSQNLHAELLLRRLGAQRGSGSIADGQAVVDTMMAAAGVPRWAYDFADGSGMSSYNRVTPRAAVRLLQWNAAQRWGAAWRATLPVGGVDGSLARRFKGGPLDGRIFAKTGSLNATSALAGEMLGASGKRLVFAFYANDIPGDRSVARTMESVLEAVAAAN
jgi:serine-type D-Ala-D-Ala carboxypeptidase/endopeptidase (penicillin-binding protein 4)